MSAEPAEEEPAGDEDYLARVIAVELGRHHRLEPMTPRDRCTCGHKAELGRLFTDHIAKRLIAQGWRKP